METAGVQISLNASLCSHQSFFERSQTPQLNEWIIDGTLPNTIGTLYAPNATGTL
jgi:hypothetical protein